MTPGKLECTEIERFFHFKRLRDGIGIKRASATSPFCRKSVDSCSTQYLGDCDLDMLRGFLKMDVREKDRRDITHTQNEPDDIDQEAGSALVQCVERFFKNPQQNYEVPLQLLQEWFSDTSTHRRHELAKLFLALLQEQGLDMEQIMGQVIDFSENSKSSEVFLEEEAKSQTLESDPQLGREDFSGPAVEMKDVSCGEEDSSSAKTVEWVDTSSCGTSSFISDRVVLKTLREYRPAPLKSQEIHSDAILEAVAKKIKLSKAINVDVPGNENQEDMMMTVVGVEEERMDGFDITQCGGYTSDDLALSSEYPVLGDKATRSVGTSPFQERALTTKCSSEPNIRRAFSDIINDKRKRVLRKSQSLESMRYSPGQAPLPPLAPIPLARSKCVASKGTITGTSVVTTRTNDCTRPSENQQTVISTPTTYKARTTFVEMSHADFMKRQILLNEKVSVRQGFRVGNQILYVPELVSCSAPHVEKPTPPLVLQTEHKRQRNPVEIKLTMVGNEVMENVVVSQNSTSHTIHYTPTHSQPPSHLNDKCSVVYVRESLPHAQPVLVATSPPTTWQEEARKKPIIAYAKRKPNETRDKGVVFGDNMKVLIAPNGILNPAQETSKLINLGSSVEREAPSTNTVASGVVNVGGDNGEVVFVKRPAEERRNPVVVVPMETPPVKPTLPKFNQTFVQNFQLKPARNSEPVPEPQTVDYIRKIPNKVVPGFNPVRLIGSDTAVVSDESSSVSGTKSSPSVAIEESIPVTTTLQPSTGVIHSTLPANPTSVSIERQAQVKSIPNAPPTQVGLLIYTQGSPEESSPVQTLLLTTLPNGSAYCVRLPPNANLHNVSTPAHSPQIDTPNRPVVVQTVPHGTPVALKTSVKKPDSIPVAPPAESNKVALLKDLKEFENVFEETKLKFEKEKQLNVGESVEPQAQTQVVSSTAVDPDPAPVLQPDVQPQQPSVVTTVSKFDCEKVVVGVKRKSESELPVVTRLYTTAKKPLIVVANYGQSGQTQVQARPVITQVCSSSPPQITHLPNKSSKGKSRSGKNYPNPAKSPPTAKPQQKPQEDEKTQQKIFAILEEYAVQKEHSPDTNNRPAPRRRSNPPSASASKKKRPLLKTKDASGDSEDGTGNFSEM